MAASDREQLKIELQQVNQQINQQTQMHSMEVLVLSYEVENRLSVSQLTFDSVSVLSDVYIFMYFAMCIAISLVHL